MKLRQPPSAAPPPPTPPLAIEYASPDALKLNPRNANRHTPADIRRLADSMRELGMNVPLIVNEDGMLLAGEARLAACRLLGWTSIPVVRLKHLSPEQALLFMLAENRFAQLSRFDPRALGQLFKELSGNLDLNLELSGFEMGDIDVAIEALDLKIGEAADEDEPLPSGPAIAQLGDVWVLHNWASGLLHRILVSDSLQSASYAALMGAELAAAVLTDPPFGGKISGYLPGKGKTKHREFVQGSEGLDHAGLAALLAPMCAHIRNVVRGGALVYMFMDWRGLEVLLRVGREELGELKNLIVWAKTNAGMGSFYRSQHELVALFKIPGAKHRNNVKLGVFGRNRTNLWTYAGMNSTAGRNTEEGDLLALHPTAKPVAMIAEAILDCTARGDIVLDPFLGSGTTLIAAERVGRRAYAIELDPLYVDCAIRRWQNATGAIAVRHADGRSFTDLEQEKSS